MVVKLGKSHKFQVSINQCLKRVLKIYWPEVISYKDLWATAKKEPVDIQTKKQKWQWIGQTLRKGQDAKEAGIELESSRGREGEEGHHKRTNNLAENS